MSFTYAMDVEPDATGSVAGVLHRGWMDLESAFSGGDHAILDATETGEDHAPTKYQKALEETLPTPMREMAERRFQSVKQSHAKVNELRNNLEDSPPT